MMRLGMGEFLEAHPDLLAEDFATGVLRDIAERLNIPEGDGVWLALDVPPSSRVAEEPSSREWRNKIRRYCRYGTGMSLTAIARRRGRIAVSRNHLDVVFDFSSIDIRIRRAGLDSNPQWLPWLGRVVQFHYERLAESPSRREAEEPGWPAR
jgi:hypothetical protein